jgi:hypothetical protein
MSPIYAGDGTNHNSSGTGGSGCVDPSLSGAGSNTVGARGAGGSAYYSSATGSNTVGARGAGGSTYYLSGSTVIAIQTHGVSHKMIKIPKNPPKNGKLLFLLWVQ